MSDNIVNHTRTNLLRKIALF